MSQDNIKTILHYEDGYILYKKEVSLARYNELLESAKDSYILLRYHYEHEITGECDKELKISAVDADYLVEDKDGNFTGLYILYNKERASKYFPYQETLLDTEGRFGFHRFYTSEGDTDWSEKEDINLYYQGKLIEGSNKQLKLPNTFYMDKGLYLDEVNEEIKEEDIHLLDLSDLEKSLLYSESLKYGLYVYELGDEKNGFIVPSLDNTPNNIMDELRIGSFPIVNRNTHQLVGFIARVEDNLLHTFLIGKEDNYHKVNLDSGRDKKTVILVRMKKDKFIQHYIECRVRFGQSYWRNLAEQI